MDTSNFTPAQRQAQILEYLTDHSNIKVSYITTKYDVSEVTARHDLATLEKQGLIHRVRGGAISSMQKNAVSYPEDRINLNTDAKDKIGKACADLVCDGDAIIADIGTTSLSFVKQLSSKKNITIITGDLAIASYASINLPDAEVLLLGGHIRKGHLYLAGALTLDSMSKIYADKAFVSADGFTPDSGFTVDHDFSVSIKRMYIKNASKRYMMLDSSKFGKTSFYQYSQVGDFDSIIVEDDYDGIMQSSINESRNKPELIIANS